MATSISRWAYTAIPLDLRMGTRGCGIASHGNEP